MSRRHPRTEAQALLVEEGLSARVLEPSPPASTDPEWLPHGPAAAGGPAPPPLARPPPAGGWGALGRLAREPPRARGLGGRPLAGRAPPSRPAASRIRRDPAGA